MMGFMGFGGRVLYITGSNGWLKWWSSLPVELLPAGMLLRLFFQLVQVALVPLKAADVSGNG